MSNNEAAYWQSVKDLSALSERKSYFKRDLQRYEDELSSALENVKFLKAEISRIKREIRKLSTKEKNFRLKPHP